MVATLVVFTPVAVDCVEVVLLELIVVLALPEDQKNILVSRLVILFIR